MPLNHIPFLDKTIDLPLRFYTRLPFSDADKLTFPWLADGDRYYSINEVLSTGGRAVAYKGFVSDKKGHPLPEYQDITLVIKIPNLSTVEYTSDQIKEYLGRQCDEYLKEWQLTRSRLNGCIYANPVFDVHIEPFLYLDQSVLLPITAQLFLKKARTLDDYLLHIRQRMEKYKGTRSHDKQVDNWEGMNDPDKWLDLAKCIAVGLNDIHQRRVVHGDIWPPNIFIQEEAGKLQVIFIDFGESFPIEPKGPPQEIRDHAYRAPERKDAQSIVTKAADIYSYGKLLLHLAIGEEPILSRTDKGYKRREFIRKKFAEHKKIFATENPFIIDIICNCVSFDPVDRPGMSDVMRALNSYVDLKSYKIRKPEVTVKLDALKRIWDTVIPELANRKNTNNSVGPFLEEIIEQKVDDIAEMITGLLNDVVILNDTRERLILALITLFQRLQEGDRFISLTSPSMWRGSALGLDGRYFTATQLAATRGASVQRTFVFSIEEVGHKWASLWADKLDELKGKNNPRIAKLADSLRFEIRKYIASHDSREDSEEMKQQQKKSRNHLMLIIESYRESSGGICSNLFDKAEKFSLFQKCEGIYLGLLPVATVTEMRILKAAHPASVFYYNDAEPSDKYLLMMTDCHARNSSEDTIIEPSGPELRGIMLFKSISGVPGDRIKKMEQLFGQSINIGEWIDDLHTKMGEIKI